MRFEDTKFACIDFETTGFSPKSSRAIELAIVDVQHGIIGESWTSLLNPGPDCDIGAEHIHGINSNWVSDAPSFSDVAGDIYARLDGSVIVAHNVSFDLGFLYAEMDRCGCLPRGFLFPNWDSRKASVYAPITPPTRKLSDVTAAFGIDIANAHQALDDTYAVAEIVAAITPLVGDDISFENLFSSPNQPAPSGLFKLRPR